MKMKFKRVAAVLIATVMLIAATAGCADSGGTPASSTAPAGSTSAANNAAASGYPMKPEELGSGTVKWSETDTADGWTEVTNEGGVTLGYTKSSGVSLIQVEGLAFKDLNRNGELDLYEDWRQDAGSRAADLASQLSAEEIAGVMAHSSTFGPSDDAAAEKGNIDEGVRTLLNFGTAFPVDTQAKWNNVMQEYCESKDFGIPMNISTNPRTTPVWPDNLALAATFDPELVFEISKGLSKEYRALPPEAFWLLCRVAK